MELNKIYNEECIEGMKKLQMPVSVGKGGQTGY